MLELRINPVVAKDLKNIRDYIAEDSEENAARTIEELYGKFENIQMFPEMDTGDIFAKKCYNDKVLVVEDLRKTEVKFAIYRRISPIYVKMRKRMLEMKKYEKIAKMLT